MSSEHLIQDLNPEQKTAITRTEGPLLVIAGAGSGKTRVITNRIAWLIEEKGVDPQAILAATFTNKAAREMRRRVIDLCRRTDARQLPIATFHSHCANILREEAEAADLTPRFTICDATDQTALLRDSIRELGLDPKHLPPRQVREVISLAKMRLMTGIEAEEFVRQTRDAEQADVYRLYQKRLKASDAVDFDDLLLLLVDVWRRNPEILRKYQERFHYVLVDEYQDTNLAQFEIVRMLTSQHRNLCVVGDEDQSIYSWRGAEITNLLEFQRHFAEAELIRLEQNYRSKGNILKAASAVINRNTQRLGKKLWTDGGEGDPVLVIDASSEHSEARRITGEMQRMRAEGLPYEEMAVFYRVNALSRVYEEALREAGIPYRVVGGVGFYDRAEIKDLMAYLQVIANPGNSIALMRIINTPRRGIGRKALAQIVNYAERTGKSMFELLLDEKQVAEAGLKGKGAKGAFDLARMIVGWNRTASGVSIHNLMEDILKQTAYIESLGDPKSMEALSRTENIKEFLGALKEHEKQAPESTLQDFLEMVALRAAGDERGDEGPGVSLMTVHNAKGLEFDAIFIVALEKDLFPNARAVRDQGHAEEERRLFYVALTRARKRVYVSHATKRFLYGKEEWLSPSIFLREIPHELKKSLDAAELGPIAVDAPFGIPDAAVQDTTKETQKKVDPVVSPAMPRREKKKTRRFQHDLLGIVEVLNEKGYGSQKRITVRDSGGKRHTLMAAYARLKPLPNHEEPRQDDDGDEMPF